MIYFKVFGLSVDDEGNPDYGAIGTEEGVSAEVLAEILGMEPSAFIPIDKEEYERDYD